MSLMRLLTENERGTYSYIDLMATHERTQTHDLSYAGPCAFILEHGRFWTPADLPATIKTMPIKQCFDNAYRLATRRKGLRYVEGIALGCVIHHGWCVDADGHVVDPTWGRDDLRGSVYFGVEIPLALVQRARRSGCASAIYNWENGFPLLQQPFGGHRG